MRPCSLLAINQPARQRVLDNVAVGWICQRPTSKGQRSIFAAHVPLAALSPRPGSAIAGALPVMRGPVIAAALLFDTSASARLEGDAYAAEIARAPDAQALETGRLALRFAAVSAAQRFGSPAAAIRGLLRSG